MTPHNDNATITTITTITTAAAAAAAAVAVAVPPPLWQLLLFFLFCGFCMCLVIVFLLCFLSCFNGALRQVAQHVILRQNVVVVGLDPDLQKQTEGP